MPTSSSKRARSFENACRQYVHRYTMEHVPDWARRPHEGRYYAPHFRTDREWYEHTRFPGEPDYLGVKGDCYTTGQTWPLGQWLDAPYRQP